MKRWISEAAIVAIPFLAVLSFPAGICLAVHFNQPAWLLLCFGICILL